MNIPTELLEDQSDINPEALDTADIRKKLDELFAEFNLPVAYHTVEIGPTITRYNYTAKPSINLSKLQEIQDNISLHLAVPSVRVLAPVPSKPYVGIEVPNSQRETVRLKNILESKDFLSGKNSQQSKKMELPIILGKNITGKIITTDLAKLPHLLIAGATGSGKSVCVNTIIMSLLYLHDNFKLIMVDPKIVELKVYDGIPQLLTPVITNPIEALSVLEYLVDEMQQRYRLLESYRVRNLHGYNELNPDKRLPYLVVVIDEFADLVAVKKKELEKLLATLSAMARATGIHLVLATQRPSVDIITGVIKANFPSRVAFRVPSAIDSRVILDCMGAESLLGKGDMLFNQPTFDNPERIQGVYLSDKEVTSITHHLSQNYTVNYKQLGQTSIAEPLLDKAIELLVGSENKTASFLQRELLVPYSKAKHLLELALQKEVANQ